MKSRIALIAIGGMIAGMELSKHKKVIKDGVKNMIGKAMKAIGEVSEKREKTISKRIERLEEDRLDAIEESDFEKADEINSAIKNMGKEKMKKRDKFGLGIAAVGVGVGVAIAGHECFEYYVLGGDLI